MNIFDIFTVISIAILVAALAGFVYIWILPYRSSRLLTRSRLLAIGVFAAALVLFLPYYWSCTADRGFGFLRYWETFWSSVHHTVRLFVIDTAIDDVTAFAQHEAYAFVGTVLYILAPVATAGVILSFFQSFFAYAKCFFLRRRDMYIFSELSEKSLALATDIKKWHKSSFIVFTDVFEENNEENYEIRERAKELGALCFQKDMATMGTLFRSKSASIHLFAIGENELENVRQAFALSKDTSPYTKRKNVFLYVFSTEVESEILMENIPHTGIRIRRINDIRSLVWNDLYNSGNELFETAIPEADGTKRIRALIVGTGGHGTEMIKALSWFCQMEGFRIEIHAFDRDPMAEDRFKVLAPGLMDPENNGVYIPGEAECTIVFHPGVSVGTASFEEKLLEVGLPSFVFVSTGDDARNVSTAVRLRQFYRQKHMGEPLIRAIVYDSRSKQTLNDAQNWKGQAYGIKFVGDLEASYSEAVILRQVLEEQALATHMKYGAPEADFYRYEYNYRSSMASALHLHLRKTMGICYFPDEENVSPEDKHRLEVLEHRRWNAYMRSEGFVYSGSEDKVSRDDLAKMHHNLIPFDRLSEEDKRKDSAVALGK